MNVQDYLAAEVSREKARTKRKIFYALLLLGAVYVIAIETYHYVEGWDWLDSIYFTTSTITTVGYGDVTPLTDLGKMVTIPLMLVGIGVGFYVIYAIQDYGRSRLSTLAGGRVDEMAKQIDTHINRRKEKGKKK
jgi:voltage-gated potassium channel Kch